MFHFDYDPKHILIEYGCITGIVDFENCMRGDPVYDLAWKEYFDEGSESLRKGYLSVSNLPVDYVERQKLYGLRIGIELVRWFALENHVVGMAHAQKK